MAIEGTPGLERNPPRPTSTIALVAAWAAVSLPLLWGVAQTIRKALALFQ